MGLFVVIVLARANLVYSLISVHIFVVLIFALFFYVSPFFQVYETAFTSIVFESQFWVAFFICNFPIDFNGTLIYNGAKFRFENQESWTIRESQIWHWGYLEGLNTHIHTHTHEWGWIRMGQIFLFCIHLTKMENLIHSGEGIQNNLCCIKHLDCEVVDVF